MTIRSKWTPMLCMLRAMTLASRSALSRSQRNEPRLTILHHGANRALIEPEFGRQADDVATIALIFC